MKNTLRILAFSLFLGSSALPLSALAIGRPSNVDIVGSKYTNDRTPTFTWDNPSGTRWNDYSIDDGDKHVIGERERYTVPALPDGWHTFFIRAGNNSGDLSDVSRFTFLVDTTGPTVPRVTPGTAREDRSVVISVEPYGEAAVAGCKLYVEGRNKGDMERSGNGKFSRSYTFTNDGSYSVYAKCTDGDGNTTKGAVRTIKVN
jgi:hypothetical protein